MSDISHLLIQNIGLAVNDGRVRQLVTWWAQITCHLGARVQATVGERAELEDVGTLAAIYASAVGIFAPQS